MDRSQRVVSPPPPQPQERVPMMIIGTCGVPGCGTPLQPLPKRPKGDGDPGWWRFADPGDKPALAALKAHVAIVHDDLAYLPPLVKT